MTRRPSPCQMPDCPIGELKFTLPSGQRGAGGAGGCCPRCGFCASNAGTAKTRTARAIRKAVTNRFRTLTSAGNPNILPHLDVVTNPYLRNMRGTTQTRGHKGTVKEAFMKRFILLSVFGLVLITAALAQQRGPAVPALGDGPWVYDTSERSTRIRVSVVTKGLSHPWSLAFLPDGSMLVTERPGRLRIVRDGVLDPNPITGVPQ